MQVHDVGIVGEGDDEIGQRRADIADHDAADHEQAHAPDLPGDRQHEAHREHRARERRRDQHADVDTSPRLSSATMVTDTVSFAPDEMPRTKGPAMGL